MGGARYGDTCDVHDLCDINPTTLHVTLPRQSRVRKEVPSWLTIHRGNLGERDITWHEGLAIVTPARAILDGMETNVGQRFIDQALETARRRNLLSMREQQTIERNQLAMRLDQLARAPG